MAQTFNFETRELCPYGDNWNVNGNVVIGGSLWYVKERDGLFLKDKTGFNYQVARGFPAAMFARGDSLNDSSFKARDFFFAYSDIIQPFAPKRPANHIPAILEDLEYTLEQLLPFDKGIGGYVDMYTRMKVGVMLRDMINPFHLIDLEFKLTTNYFYACRFKNQTETQLLSSTMPNFADRQVAAIIFSKGINQPDRTLKCQFDGFAAAVFHLAIMSAWESIWGKYNFADLKCVRRINQASRENRNLIEIADLQQLSFDFPISVENLCKLYMDTFLPIMRKVWEHRPDVQLECVEGDNIYTYIYACEQRSQEGLVQSELFANLNRIQQKMLYGYSLRFSEWLVKNYPITPASQRKIMDAISRDIPPIQLTINNDVQIIQHGGETKEEKHKKELIKFAFIISDDKNEILKIHKRIEMYLLSPAKLRDELRRLQDEGLVALPMENPTEIARELQRIWGNKTPKIGSFKTTWCRVKC